MAKTNFIEIGDFSPALYQLQDETKAPLGSARRMVNALISDRKGVTKRPGTSVLGTFNTGQKGCKSLYTYVKAFGSAEIPVKNYDDEVEYLHPTTLDWARLENGFTVDSEFGFKEHVVNTDNESYLYMGNRYEEYRRWPGSTAVLAVTLAGGETTITVDTLLKSQVLDSKTASASSATTLDVTGTPWAASQHVNFYVYITSGVHAGKIRKITASTTSQITFDTLGSDPGSCDFEIRIPAFPVSGTLMINGTTVVYTAIPEYNKFTVASAPAAAIDSPVTVLPTKYPAAPKGNRLEVNLTRMYVGNVRSGLSRDSSGNLQGSQNSSSYYVAKLLNAADFAFSPTRVAGEGDIVSVAYGKGDITDIINQEGKVYVFKKNYIEAAAYSQDENDLIIRDPLKPGYGSVGRVIRGKDDVFFVTEQNEITSLGRVQQKDSTPQSINLGYNVKRLLDTMDFTGTAGAEFKDRVLVVARANAADQNTNRILLFNKTTGACEGVWLLSASAFSIYENQLHFAESSTPNVFKMFDGDNDLRGDDKFGITTIFTSSWHNFTPINFNQQAIQGVALQGYIRTGTTIQINLYKDFSATPFATINFAGSETGLLSPENFSVFLGSDPLGVDPMGSITDPDADGKRHFNWIFYFPPQYGTHFSYEFVNSGKDQFMDITRIGLSVYEDVDFNQLAIKTS